MLFSRNADYLVKSRSPKIGLNYFNELAFDLVYNKLS